MKKYLIITLISISALTAAKAQEYKVNKNSGKLDINLTAVTVEGYSGDQIVFKSTTPEEDQDPRAKGLRAISGAGYTDNTGLGISVTEKGSTVEVHQVASNGGGVKILVPKNVIISFSCHKTPNVGNVHFKNLSNEIEISTDYNSIKLENVTGPLAVRALYGSVDAIFSEPVKGPVSIASIYSTVDVSIPGATKANVKLSSSHGSIMASAKLNIEMEKSTDGDMVKYGGNDAVNGKLNGGGAEFKLNSEYGKIYLRETK